MTPKPGASPKLDLKKSLSGLYNQRGNECTLVTPPSLHILSADGEGDPNTAQSWTDAVSALYSAAYTLNFQLKAQRNMPDFVVMPLEALWWVLPGQEFRMVDKSNWIWRALIVMPDFVTQQHVDEALASAKKKKGLDGLQRVFFGEFDEGPSAQVLHIGPYADEPSTIQRLHAFIRAHGQELSGKHHEIYLSDPGRVAPERMKTIVRQPVTQELPVA